MRNYTIWGENLDPSSVLPEYPRPQFVRDSFQNLNGYWEYEVTRDAKPPHEYSSKILVPFSPEAPLSGLERALRAQETAWYALRVELTGTLREQVARGDRLVVNFGAVDQEATVIIDNTECGTHVGGYLPFSITVPEDAARRGTFELVVRVKDRTDSVPLSRGKQRTKRGGIWYAPQSGIWQTVWLEAIPRGSAGRIDYVADIERSCVTVTVSGLASESHSDGGAAGENGPQPFALSVHDGNEVVARVSGHLGDQIEVPIENPKLWSPESPHLYDVKIEIAGEEISSYFAMRTVGVGPDREGVPRLLLNGEPYFHMGVLDQGYWPDGMYTAPADEAFVWDIQTMKDMGFNMLRKHIKVEPMRFYYHCDRLGMLVWQDMINGGGKYKPQVITTPVLLPWHRKDNTERAYRAFGREDAAGRAQFEAELEDLVNHLRAVPSIVLWVPFNEGWGQFDAARISARLRELDPTRLIDHASGWHDQKVSDVRSLHTYFRKFRMPKDDSTGRAVVLSEFGGYNYEVPGSKTTSGTFGYKKARTPQELEQQYVSLMRYQILPAVPQGLAATVYTQLSDVEDEVNGMVTYDRKTVKLALDVTRQLSYRIVSAM